MAHLQGLKKVLFFSRLPSSIHNSAQVTRT